MNMDGPGSDAGADMKSSWMSYRLDDVQLACSTSVQNSRSIPLFFTAFTDLSVQATRENGR